MATSSRFLTALIFASFAVANPAFAKDKTCQMSDGYIDNGIGGTGYSDPKDGKDGGDDKGIGGTGYKPKGIGGTGDKIITQTVYVTGTVYAFGSICVNGIRITYDSKTPIKDGSKQTNQDALKIGHVVRVIADKDTNSGQIRARNIEIQRIVGGIVSRIDLSARKIEIMGEQISAQKSSILRGLSVGQHVQVSGLRDTANRVLATRVDSDPSLTKDVVEGTVIRSPDGKVLVGNTPVSRENGGRSLTSGRIVRITGTWSGDTLKIEKTEDVSKLMRGADYASVESYIENSDNKGHIRTIDKTIDGSQVVLEDTSGKIIRAIVSGPVVNGRVRVDRLKEISRNNLQKDHERSQSQNSGSGSDSTDEDDSENIDDIEDTGDVGDIEDVDDIDNIDDTEDVDRESGDNSGHGGGGDVERIEIEHDDSTIEDRPEHEDNIDLDRPDDIEPPEIEKPEDIDVPEIEKPEKPEKIEDIKIDHSGHGSGGSP